MTLKNDSMSMENGEELAIRIAEALQSSSSKVAYAMATALKDRDGRCGSVGALIYESIKNCPTVRYLNSSVYFFDGCVYRQVTSDVFFYALDHFLSIMGVNIADITRYFRHFLSRAYQSLRMCAQLAPTFNVMAFRNGVVDMDDGILRPFSPEHHVIHQNSYDYDPSADCRLWKSFLRDVLPERESRLTLQMFLSLGLHNRGMMNDKVENCLMLFGVGSNGKSVIYDTVKGVFGAANISEMGLMALIKGGDEKYRNMHKIDGKVFNYCPEIAAHDISMYSDAFKSLCSGENQYARVLGKDIYTVKNVPWIIFNMNNMPKSSDSSHGFFRRFLYVIFDRIIPDEQQNKHLTKDLEVEYSGILNWVIRGKMYLRERKYQFPLSEASERRKFLTIGENNPTLAWMKIRGIRPNSVIQGELYEWIPGIDLYNDMIAVAKQNAFCQETQKRFALEMHKYGWSDRTNKKRVGRGIIYRVYGLSANELKGEVPDLLDMEITPVDEFDKNVEYDPSDIN